MNDRAGLPWLAGGLLVTALGTIWMLQGLGIIGGSVMSGHSRWVVIGVGVAVLGLALCTNGVRKGRRRNTI